jgi:hypothetical protein
VVHMLSFYIPFPFAYAVSDVRRLEGVPCTRGRVVCSTDGALWLTGRMSVLRAGGMRTGKIHVM